MGVRSGVAVALVASALLGFTVAVPQDAHLGVAGPSFRFLTGKGANVADAQLVHPGDGDVGRLLDRIDGRGVDPNLLKNLDRAALADLLGNLTAEQLGALGMDEAAAAAAEAALRDPTLTPDALAALVGGLADRGMMFLDANGNGRFDGGEQAFADLDGDGQVAAGDVRLGVLAVLASADPGLDPGARGLLEAFQAAGGVGLANPFGALDRGNATAATAPMAAPLPYPSDRGGGPLLPVCVQAYSPALTCHQRTFVQQRITVEGNHYLFQPDTSQQRTPIPIEPDAPGVRAKGTLHLRLDPQEWTPVPALTPNDRLVATVGPSIALARDADGMVWARGAAGNATVTLTWAIDAAYYDLVVPPTATTDDVPAALRPTLDAPAQAAGIHIAQGAGATGRSYGAALAALAKRIHGFGVGVLPDRDARADDLVAVAEAQVGCARQRSEAFVLAAQALGIPARLVINEAHAFAEAYVPQAGWRMVDLGGCGRVQVAARPGHQELLVPQDLPFAAGQGPASQAPAGPTNPALTTGIDITQSPQSLRRNSRFTVAGPVTSPAGPVPDGIPVTFTYNRTKGSPGTAFCSGLTAGGGYSATCELGADTPAGSLQLVARLAPSLLGGQRTAPAYSDPSFTVQKATTLTLDGPPRTAADVPLAYLARLVDEDGQPVPQAGVTLQLDGGAAQRQDTDADGRALFTLQAAQGTHTLAARFGGADGYDPGNGTLHIDAAAMRLTAAVDLDALAQGTLRVTGSAAPGDSVTATWQDETQGATADAGGAYHLVFQAAPPPGLGLVTVESGGVGVAAGYARTVAAEATLEAPQLWDAGSAVPLVIHLSGPAALPLSVLADGEVVAHALAQPGAATQVLLQLAPGDHTLAVRAEPGTQLTTAWQSVRVGHAEALLDPVPAAAPGGQLALAGTLLFDGRPAARPVTLALLGANATRPSDASGRFRLALAVPADAPAGPATAVLGVPTLGLQQEVAVRVQRAARLVLEAPGLSFHAFGSTPVTVRGEGTLHLRVGGATADAGLTEVPTGTLLLRTVHLDAVAIPTSDGLAPASASRDILVVNPLTVLGLPVLAIAGTATGTRAARAARLARAHRHRFLPPPQRIPAKVLEPDLPPPVPRVLDPAEDAVLRLRVRRRGAWQVRDGRGRVLPATIDGHTLTIPVPSLAPGLHQIRLERGRKSLVVPVAVQPLRSALDDATRRLLQNLNGAEGFVTMEGLESALVAAGADARHALAVRRAAEQGLYAGPRCDRAGFHAFFAALDRAQAGA